MDGRVEMLVQRRLSREETVAKVALERFGFRVPAFLGGVKRAGVGP